MPIIIGVFYHIELPNDLQSDNETKKMSGHHPDDPHHGHGVDGLVCHHVQPEGLVVSADNYTHQHGNAEGPKERRTQ